MAELSQYLLFDIADLSVAVASSGVRAIHEQLTIHPVAGTRNWFLGMGVAQGKLLPVTDLGTYAGTRGSRGHILELDVATGIAGLQVDTVHGLVSTKAIDNSESDTRALPGGDMKLTFKDKSVNHDSRMHRLLDLAALVQSPTFLSIAAGDDS